MVTCITKRSSWASGKAKVPSCSIGFYVAITRNNSSRQVQPHGDLPLGHRLEQCRLHLRRRD
jgi:hypothetical protein